MRPRKPTIALLVQVLFSILPTNLYSQRLNVSTVSAPGPCLPLSSYNSAIKADGTPEASAVQTAINNAMVAGGCIVWPAATVDTSDAQIVLPATQTSQGSTSNYVRKSLRITCPQIGVCVWRSNYAGTVVYGGGPKLLAYGIGYLEIDHIDFEDTGSDSAAWIQATGGFLSLHDNLHDTTCGKADKNDWLIHGGTDSPGQFPDTTSPGCSSGHHCMSGKVASGTGFQSTEWWQGQFDIHDNLVCGRRFTLAQSSVNGGTYDNNWCTGINTTASPGACFDLVGFGNSNRGQLSRATQFTKNGLELGGRYACAFHIKFFDEVNFTGNQAWDGSSSNSLFCPDTGWTNGVAWPNFLQIDPTLQSNLSNGPMPAGVSLAGYTATTGSIGGGALLVNSCATGTVTLNGVGVGQPVVASPNTADATLDPTKVTITAQVTATNTIKVAVCALVAETPVASTYTVRMQ